MEKLKAALDKARATREAAQGAPRPDAPEARAPVPPVAPGIVAEWEALKPLEAEPSAPARKRLVTLAGGAEATPFDVLRTRVVQLTGANDWRRIAITSPLPASGKTTTAINLAIALARHGDLRVILIDLDMRRPGLGRLLDMSGGASTWEMLEGRVSFAEQARSVTSNLAVSMNNLPMGAAADLLLRRATRDALDEIERRYQPDLMLFDLPPMLVGDETRAFSSSVDCALLVVESDVTTSAQVDTCEKELAEQTNVLGIVLNKCRFAAEESGYYYEYS